MKTNNQILTIEHLNVVLEAVAEYYKFNAVGTKPENCLTVSQLLLGATRLATQNLQEYKNEGLQ